MHRDCWRGGRGTGTWAGFRLGQALQGCCSYLTYGLPCVMMVCLEWWVWEVRCTHCHHCIKRGVEAICLHHCPTWCAANGANGCADFQPACTVGTLCSDLAARLAVAIVNTNSLTAAAAWIAATAGGCSVWSLLVACGVGRCCLLEGDGAFLPLWQQACAGALAFLMGLYSVQLGARSSQDNSTSACTCNTRQWYIVRCCSAHSLRVRCTHPLLGAVNAFTLQAANAA